MSKKSTVGEFQIGPGLAILEVHYQGDEQTAYEVTNRKNGTSYTKTYDSFDAAIVGALTNKYGLLETVADRLICRMLGIEGGE